MALERRRVAVERGEKKIVYAKTVRWPDVEADEVDFGASPAGLAPDFAAYVLDGGRSEAVTGLGVRLQIDF